MEVKTKCYKNSMRGTKKTSIYPKSDTPGPGAYSFAQKVKLLAHFTAFWTKIPNWK